MDNHRSHDTKYIKRRDRGNDHAWQFQFEMDPIKETKYFSDKKYGSREASLAAAQAHRDSFLQTASELGLIPEDWRASAFDLPIHLKLSERNTSGINGVCRIVSRRAGRATEVHWAANYRDESDKQKQQRFYVKKIGEKAALVRAIAYRIDYVDSIIPKVPADRQSQIEEHRDDLSFLKEYIESLVDEDVLFSFLNMLNNPALTATEKEALVAARIGQTRFRKNVLASWGDCCCVTKASCLINASHIKPWAHSDDTERLDPFNGLALSPSLDRAFDAGLISFLDTGQICISPHFRLDAPKLGIDATAGICGLQDAHMKYLAYHRTRIYKSD